MVRHEIPRAGLLGALVALTALTACGAPPPIPAHIATPTPTDYAPSQPSARPVPAGPIPILIDTDMAGDDLLAVMALLREPSVEVRAIAIDGNGEVHCLQGVNNMNHLLDAFGRDDIPIGCGREEPGPSGQLFPDEWRAGADAFYGVEFPPLQGSTESGDAATLIADTIRASSTPLTLVPLGTWTNMADAFAADPDLVDKVERIHAMAGTIDAPGNINYGSVTFEHKVEWNVGVDPESFAAVLATDVPITLVPLDATNDVPVPDDFAATLEADHAAAGADIAFEMFARSPALTQETSFWDTLAVMALVDPSLVEWEEMTVDVETEGPIAGRIDRSSAGRPIRAAMSADADAFHVALLEALRRGDPRPEPFEAATMTIRWDGTSCTIEDAPATTGTVLATLANEDDAGVGFGIATTVPPKRWQDLIDYVTTSDLSDPNAVTPDWLVEVSPFSVVDPDSRTTTIVELPTGEMGAICATGTFPDLEFHDAGAFTVTG